MEFLASNPRMIFFLLVMVACGAHQTEQRAVSAYRQERSAQPPEPHTAQDVCLPILDDVLGRPLFSASVRLPSPVVNSPGAMMLPFDKLLQNVTGSLYAVQPANHVVPAVPYLTPVSQRIYGFSCPMGSFLILTEDNSSCTGLACGIFNSTDEISDSLAMVMDKDISNLLSGKHVDLSCDPGYAVTALINNEVCEIDGVLRACITIHCRRFLIDAASSKPTDVTVETFSLLDALQLFDQSGMTPHVILVALRVARDISLYFNDAAVGVTELNEVLTKSLSMVSSQLRSDLNNILFTSQLLFVASTQVVESLERFGMLYPPLDSLFITFATKEISQTLIDVDGNSSNTGVHYAVVGESSTPRRFSGERGYIDLSRAQHYARAHRDQAQERKGGQHAKTAFMQVDLASDVMDLLDCHEFGPFSDENCTQRVQMNIFESSSFFETSMPMRARESLSGVVNSPVVGVVLNHGVSVQLGDDQVAVVLRFTPYKRARRNEMNVCAFWDYTLNSGLGGWNDAGCRMTADRGTQVVCQCSHLTNFAILLTPNIVETQALEVITYIGCGVSILGVLATIVIKVVNIKSLDYGDMHVVQKYQQHFIMIGLCLAVLFEYIGFILAVNSKPQGRGCWAGLVTLHYFALSMFAWTVLEGCSIFKQVVRVFNKPMSSFRTKAILFCQGLPALIVGIAIACAQHSYIDDDRCRMRTGIAFYLTFLAPVTIAIIFNIAVFARVQWVLYKVSKSIAKERQTIGKYAQRFRAAVGIFIILGLGWLPGYILVFFETPPAATQWIFGVLAAFQGLLIFLTQIKNEVPVFKRRASSVILFRSNVRKQSNSSKTKKPQPASVEDDLDSSLPDMTPSIKRNRSLLTMISFLSSSFDAASVAPESPRENFRSRTMSGNSQDPDSKSCDTSSTDGQRVEKSSDGSSTNSGPGPTKMQTASQRRVLYKLVANKTASVDSVSSVREIISENRDSP